MAFGFSHQYQKRVSCEDEGRMYENLLISNLALNLTLDQNVTNFVIKSNVDQYWAFDDVIVELDESGIKRQYGFQLKYIHSMKKTLTKRSLNADHGFFAIKKYCDDYDRIVKEKNISFVAILMVRINFTVDENEVFTNGFCKYKIKKMSDLDKTHQLCSSMNKQCICYCFLIEDEDGSPGSEKYKQFFKNFVLCITTDSVSDIEKSIVKTFDANFSQAAASEKFLEIVKSFNKHCYNLEKQKVKDGITLSLLDKSMSLSFETDLIEPQKLLIQAVLENTVTHLQGIKGFDDFGKDIKSEITEKEVKKLDILFNFISNDKNDVYTKALWLKGKCPLIVVDSQASRAAISLSPNLKYILISETPEFVDNVKNLISVADLEQNCNLLFNNICRTYQCQLQNKIINLKTLLDIDPEIAKTLTINELVAMAFDKLNIGEVKLNLPIPNISPRRLINENQTKINEYEMVENESKLTIILGKSGIGKTTLSKNLVFISKPNLWSVYINARDLPHKNNNLQEFKKHLLETQKQDLNLLNYNMFKIFLNQGLVRLVWDALDEADERSLENIVSLIMQFYNENAIQYITARTHLISKLKNKFREISFKVLILAEFDELEQQYYIQRKLNLTDEELEKTLVKIKFYINLSHCTILEIFLITELLKQKKITNDDAIDENFTADQLYEYFAYEKLKVYYFHKLLLDPMNKGVKRMVDKEIIQYITLFKQLSVQLYFNDVLSIHVKYDLKMLQIIKNDGDVTGFIINIDEISDSYAKAQFFYNSMSEYFAARFLADNLHIFKKIKSFYFDSKYNNIQLFFDLILARGCKAHCAILYNNWSLLHQCTDKQIQKVDKAGRNALQILILKNMKNYSNSNHRLDNNRKIIIELSPDIRTEESVSMIETIKYFSRKVDVSAKDAILNFDTFEYLEETNFFLAMGILYVELESFPEELFQKFKYQIIASCILYDYCDILDVLEELPYIFLLDNCLKNFESLLLLYKCTNWIKKLTLEPILKCATNFSLFLFKNWNVIYSNTSCTNLFFNNSTLTQDIHEIIKFVIEKTLILINEKDIIGKTFFLRSCKIPMSQTLDLLLENDADISITDNKGDTCLHYASKWECSFLSNQCFCHNNSISIVKSLIEKGAEVNARNKEDKTPLHCAVFHKSFQFFQLLLENNADINAIDNNKRTVLHSACLCRHPMEMMKCILEKTASVNCQDVDNNTPLHFAAFYQKKELVECLLNYGANVNIGNNDGSRPLQMACLSGDLTKVKLLLDNNAIIDATDNANQTILHYACSNKNATLEMIQFILEKKVFIDSADKNNKTPLHLAALHCADSTIIKCLLTNGANATATDTIKRTVLHYICKNPVATVESVKFILTKGVSVNCVDLDGNTPLHFAASNFQTQIIKCLLENGANVNSSNNSCLTPLHNSAKRSSINIVNLLLENNADINATDSSNQTILHCASQNRFMNLATIAFMLENKISVNSADINNKTPLHLIALHNSIEQTQMANLFLTYGANFNAIDDKKNTVLHYACKNQDVEPNFVEFLLKQGVSVNCKNIDNDTPLHFAVLHSRIEIVHFLILKMADVNSTNNLNLTPLHHAVKNENLNMINLLVENNAVIENNLPIPIDI